MHSILGYKDKVTLKDIADSMHLKPSSSVPSTSIQSEDIAACEDQNVMVNSEVKSTTGPQQGTSKTSRHTAAVKTQSITKTDIFLEIKKQGQ